jgi:DNA-binding NarL/FixJ family response regulator
MAPSAKIHATFIVGRRWAADTGGVSISVLIVDDNEPWMAAAAALLEREGVSVSGVVSSSATALRDVRELRPDVVLVDIFLGAENGLELARQLSDDEGCRSEVILISSHAEDDFVDLISASPARGFLPKSELSAQAIREQLAA